MFRVLYVDDDELSRVVLAEALQKEGIEVLLAVDGMDALRILESGLLPSLVITDIRMPNMDGRELIGKLKQNPIYRNIPRMVISGEVDLSDLESSCVVIFHRPALVRAIVWQVLQVLGMVVG